MAKNAEVNGSFWTQPYSVPSKLCIHCKFFFLILCIERGQEVHENHIASQKKVRQGQMSPLCFCIVLHCIFIFVVLQFYNRSPLLPRSCYLYPQDIHIQMFCMLLLALKGTDVALKGTEVECLENYLVQKRCIIIIQTYLYPVLLTNKKIDQMAYINSPQLILVQVI